MSLDKYCFAELGSKEVICGNARLFGGIKSIFTIKQGQTTITDWTSASEWTAAIADGSVKVFKEIKGEYPQAAETISESEVAGQPDILDSFTHTLTWRDRAVTANNITFYNSLNEFTGGGVGWWEPKNSQLKVIEDVDVRFMAKLETLADDKTVQIFQAQAQWDSILLPAIYDAPSNAEEVLD